jgi:hypothetical protein
MNLMPLANLLQAQNIGVQGASLFVDFMPAECQRGVLLRNRLSGTPIDYELPGYYKSQFQVTVRSSDYADGQTLINQALSVITLSASQVENQFFNYCRPRAQPVAFPLSSGNFVEWTVFMDVSFVEG